MTALFFGPMLLTAGCEANAPDLAPSEPKALVELLSWWLAPGEAAALQALIHTHDTAHPDVRVFNSAATSAFVAENTVARRLSHGDPPDLLQLTVRQLHDIERARPGVLEKLDGFVDGLGLREVMFPESIADVTVDGRIVGVPINAHRANALFYNKSLFAAHNLQPPTTVAELLSVCRTLKAARVTPIATAYQGWILRIMFQSIAAGQMGIGPYTRFLAGERATGLPQLREAISIFADILRDYTNPDAGEEGFGWTNAAQAIYNGDAAMFFHGDWAKGYLIELGWKPGIDFGIVGAPGASDLFVYITDLFAIPANALNPTGARDFVATVASPAGQVAFNVLKGSSPIRRDISVAALDPLGQATLNDLKHARIRLTDPNWESFHDALMKFAADRNAEALFQALVKIPPGG